MSLRYALKMVTANWIKVGVYDYIHDYTTVLWQWYLVSSVKPNEKYDSGNIADGRLVRVSDDESWWTSSTVKALSSSAGLLVRN